MRVLIFIYNLIIFPLSIAYLFYKFIKNKADTNLLKERMGIYCLTPSSGRRIWIHCSSVGEVILLEPLLSAMSKLLPAENIVITTVTETGKEEAKRRYKDIQNIFLAPVDFWLFVWNGMRRIAPLSVIVIETELWPSFMYLSSLRADKFFLVNGRMTSSSFRWYNIVKWFFGPLIDGFDAIVIQTDEDMKRFSDLKGHSERLFVAGNLKFDASLSNSLNNIDPTLKRVLDTRMLVIAGSTHAGEEEIIVNLFCKLKDAVPDFKLVIAPRHTERVGEVESILKARDINYLKRSSINSGGDSNCNVVLLDTIGELNALYSLAAVVFIGGTLVPVGGHNVIEPALHGKPVVFGPHYNNFKEACTLLIEYNGGLCVKDESEFFDVIRKLLLDNNLRENMGRNAKNAVEGQIGTTQRTMKIIGKYLRSGRV